MSTKILVDREIGRRVYELSENANDIFIVSPYIGKNAHHFLHESIHNRSVKFKLLTSISKINLQHGSIDLTTVIELMKIGNVYHRYGLHAKCYFFDNLLIMGSANMSSSGLGARSYETMVEIDDQIIVKKMRDYVNALCDEKPIDNRFIAERKKYAKNGSTNRSGDGLEEAQRGQQFIPTRWSGPQSNAFIGLMTLDTKTDAKIRIRLQEMMSDQSKNGRAFDLANYTVQAVRKLVKALIDTKMQWGLTELHAIHGLTLYCGKLGIDKKKERIHKLHLPAILEKDIFHDIDTCQEKLNEPPGCWGTGFLSFKGRTMDGDNQLKAFRILLTSFLNENAHDVLDDAIMDFSLVVPNYIASLSPILYCLQPISYSVINGPMKDGFQCITGQLPQNIWSAYIHENHTLQEFKHKYKLPVDSRSLDWYLSAYFPNKKMDWINNGS